MSGSSVDSHAGRTVEDHPAVLRLLGKRHLDMIAGRTRVVCRLTIRIWNWPRAPAEHSSFESVQVSNSRVGEVVVVKDNGRPTAWPEIVHVGGPTVSVPGPPGGLESIVEFCGALRWVQGEIVKQELHPFDIPSLIGVEVDRHIPQVCELIAMQEQPVEHEHCVRRNADHALQCAVGRFVEG